MVSTLASRLLGFLRVAVIGGVFGATGQADVLNLVFTVPNNLRKLLAEGALSSAFVPVISSRLFHDKDTSGAKALVRSLLKLQLLVLLPFCALCVIAAGPITSLLFNFPNLEQQELARDLFRWVINYLLLVSVGSVLMGTLNSHGRFFVSALSPALSSVAVIGAILLFSGQLGIFSLAVGVLAGGLAQMVSQLPAYLREGYDLKPSGRLDNPDLRRVLRQWLPVVGTASAFALNQQIAMRFASALEVGSGSALNYALVFWQLPFGLFSASITTVMFPRMSREAAADDLPALRESVSYGVRLLLALLVPSALLLAVLGKELIAVALQRGAFTAGDTVLTAEVLIYFSLGLASVGIYTYLQRLFYARGDYKTPLITALVVMTVDVALSLWLKETPLRVRGLALANSLAFTLGTFILLTRAHRGLGGLPLGAIARALGKVILTSLPLYAMSRGYLALTGEWWRGGSSLGNLGLLILIGLACVGVLLALYYALKVELVTSFLRNRFRGS
jgi:putative peptidoglycan lipid II flippase